MVRSIGVVRSTTPFFFSAPSKIRISTVDSGFTQPIFPFAPNSLNAQIEQFDLKIQLREKQIYLRRSFSFIASIFLIFTEPPFMSGLSRFFLNQGSRLFQCYSRQKVFFILNEKALKHMH